MAFRLLVKVSDDVEFDNNYNFGHSAVLHCTCARRADIETKTIAS